jgi:putative FmdB family regulatory protein
MPTYDYNCPKCGDMEIYQSIKDNTLTLCPTCKSKKLTKQLSTGSSVIFSGSGFWETDYNRSKDYSTKKKSESSTPVTAATPAKSEATPAKSESRPAKTEAKPAGPAAAR